MASSFPSLSHFRRILDTFPVPDGSAYEAARVHNEQLTKPAGSLGRLEEVALWMATWQGRAKPRVTKQQVIIFAGNHGVTAQGISAFPTEVTSQMVANFRAGGAAINQLCHTFGANISVHELADLIPTADFTKAPAMNEKELVSALQTGWDAVDPSADLLVVGEMGIGNTTAAAALSAALLKDDADNWVGRGTGIDKAGLKRKIDVVRNALEYHSPALSDPLEILRRLGGYEIAAMVGALARARIEKTPVILDGFICCSAALVLKKLTVNALDHTIAGHQSAEAAHARLLQILEKEPLLSLDMRLGEASGAVLAIGIVKGAIACHSQMATFSQAGVSNSG